MPVVEAIHVYPVKSCRGLSVEHARLERTGLAGDRLFQVVAGDGNPVTQRQAPRLALVQPKLIDGGLQLGADGRATIAVARPERNDTVVSSLLGSPVESADAGDEAADWFTDLLGLDCRLVAMTDASRNALPLPGRELETSFADAAAVLMAATASHEWLVARAESPFGMDRFRPNLVIGGTEPWDEDTWRHIAIGDARFIGGVAWPRCAIPQIDQRTAERHREPARVLRRTRWCSEAPGTDEALRSFLEGNALFGIGCWVESPGAHVVAGAEVEVLAREAPVIAAPRDDDADGAGAR